MADQRTSRGPGCNAGSNAGAGSGSNFRDAVCIDAGRVYDSCCDRDCVEDLRVYFRPCDQLLVNEATNVRAKSAEILYVSLDVEPVTFNRGYYSVDMVFYFLVECEIYTCACKKPKTICGVCTFNKKVILFGSEGSAKIFSSDFVPDDNDEALLPTNNLPRAVLQTVDPVILSANLADVCNCDCCCQMPEGVCNKVGNDICDQSNATQVAQVTLGIFTVVQLIRNVQMLVPVYDFCVPEKECISTADNPCDLFRKIKFPTNEFFPPEDLPVSSCDCPCD